MYTNVKPRYVERLNANIKGFNMAQYTNDNINTDTKAPKTDYTNLVHNGRKYDSLDHMVTQIARERANVAFKSTKLILEQLKVKKEDQVIANAMVEANKTMIHSYIKEKADSRGLFGL